MERKVEKEYSLVTIETAYKVLAALNMSADDTVSVTVTASPEGVHVTRERNRKYK